MEGLHCCVHMSKCMHLSVLVGLEVCPHLYAHVLEMCTPL